MRKQRGAQGRQVAPAIPPRNPTSLQTALPVEEGHRFTERVHEKMLGVEVAMIEARGVQMRQRSADISREASSDGTRRFAQEGSQIHVSG